MGYNWQQIKMKNKKVLFTISFIVGMAASTVILSSFVMYEQDSKSEYIQTEIGDCNQIPANEDNFCAIDKVPSGCYEGSSRYTRGRCAISIMNDILHIINKKGEVIARWNIKSDKDGILTLESEYGVGNLASWWIEDGHVYLNFMYDTYTLMDE